MSRLVLDDDYTVLPEIDLADEDRMITSSRAAYVSQFPKNVVAFDGSICTKSKGNIWNGDLDLTRDHHRLQQIATELGEDLYIFNERDYVAEKENIKWDAVLKVVRKPRKKKVPAFVEPAETETIETKIFSEAVEADIIAEIEAETIEKADAET